jgi:WD40 repeat protein
MSHRISLCALCFLLIAAQAAPCQQSPRAAGCSLPEPPLRINRPNIFSDEQEQWLGEAQADQQETEYDLLPEKDSAEMDRIGQKLLAQLPPTPIHYHFQVYEADDANGFSVAGGFVYISRKLITDALSEDEVAAVLSHEIGHIYTKQMAAELTRELKARMGVTVLGDKEDVEDKLQMLFNTPWKDSAGLSEDEEEKDELLADRVGLYALVKAGYAPWALSQSLDRTAANKGHTGNFLTDILGGTSLVSMRVRVARKLSESVSESCKQIQSGSSPEFKEFQDELRSAPIHPLVEPTPGLSSFRLDPPMKSPLRQVRFSPSGEYVLTQDGSKIHILSRSPLNLLFSIDARGAFPARFTPDSQYVVFHYPSMRVEKWKIATGKQESYHELVDYDGCLQTSLSPDGRTFVCISRTDAGIWLKLSDVASGKLFYDNKNFYAGGSVASGVIIIRGSSEAHLATVTYSQDGKVLLLLVGSKAFAFDLEERKQITLNKELTHLIDGRIAFVDSDKLVYECDWGTSQETSHDTFKMCESSFPEGIAINSFKLGYQWVEPVTNGNAVLIGPTKDAAAVLVDPSIGNAIAGFKLDSVDVYGKMVVSENEGGGVSLSQPGDSKTEMADLPASPLYGVEAAVFSSDGHFLAFSSKSRSAIWDLNSEKRVALMRPFREAQINEQNVMFAQYQPANQKPGANYQIDLKTGKAAEGAKFVIDQFQRGDVMVTSDPLEKSGDTLSNINLRVADASTGAPLWVKRYSHDAPEVQQTEDGVLLLSFEIGGDSAAEEAKRMSGKLVKSSDTRGEWVPQGLIVELADSHTGEIRKAVQVPQRTYQSSGKVWPLLYGDFLVVHGAFNNTTIYRVSDGKRMGAFYGRVIAGDARLGLLAATNRDQEVIVYGITNGKELKRVVLDQLPRAAHFIQAKNALLVLTANQSVYSIELPAASHVETALK